MHEEINVQGGNVLTPKNVLGKIIFIFIKLSTVGQITFISNCFVNITSTLKKVNFVITFMSNHCVKITFVLFSKCTGWKNKKVIFEKFAGCENSGKK